MVILVVLAAGLVGCEEPADENTLRVALTGQYPPFSTYDKEGDLVGVDVEVARAVAKHMGREVEFRPTAWADILPGLLGGKYDVIIGSMAVTPERRNAVNFSQTYYVSGAQLFIHEKYVDEIKGIEDCAGRALGVAEGETYHHYLQQNHPEINVRALGGAPEIFAQVEGGGLVGFVTDRLVGTYQIRKAGKPFVGAGGLLYTEQIAIPVGKDRPELLAGINRALTEMKESGELQAILDKWFGEGMANTDLPE
jgi:ABC-type amino acid transport substrate-binding protein